MFAVDLDAGLTIGRFLQAMGRSQKVAQEARRQ
jgi:hypothetical protein